MCSWTGKRPTKTTFHKSKTRGKEETPLSCFSDPMGLPYCDCSPPFQMLQVRVQGRLKSSLVLGLMPLVSHFWVFPVIRADNCSYSIDKEGAGTRSRDGGPRQHQQLRGAHTDVDTGLM